MSLASLRILAELTGSRPTLKRADTSGGRAVSVLRTSAHRTCETDSGSALWPTATAQDHCSRNSRPDGTLYKPGSSYGLTLTDAAGLIEPWPRMSARDGKGDGGPALDHNARPLNEVARHVVPEPWATPTAGLHNEQEDPASFQARSARLLAAGSRPLGANLGQQAQTVPHPWATPKHSDDKGGMWARMEQGRRNLNDQVLGAMPAPWATPNTIDARGGSRTGPGQVQLCHQALGATPSPSPAATARPASSPVLRLNWRFSAWLMGFPSNWLTGGHWLPQSRGGSRVSGPSATPSCLSRPTSLPGRSSR